MMLPTSPNCQLNGLFVYNRVDQSAIDRCDDAPYQLERSNIALQQPNTTDLSAAVFARFKHSFKRCPTLDWTLLGRLIIVSPCFTALFAMSGEKQTVDMIELVVE